MRTAVAFSAVVLVELVCFTSTSAAVLTGVGAATPTLTPVQLQRLDPGRGLVYEGLRQAEPWSPCAPMAFEVRTKDGISCTDGPDPGRAGIDVREPRSLEELRETLPSGATSPVRCIGDGLSGNRVQAVYAFPADRPDQYASVKPLIQKWSTTIVEETIYSSALLTGGFRSVRFVTNADCQPTVAKAALTKTGDDSLNNAINQLRARGFNDPSRKYLVWMDSYQGGCGIAERWPDDSPGADNLNNGHPSVHGMFAKITRGCWGHLNVGIPVEAHELVHTLGAVQDSAPHAAYQGHCTDMYDVMCAGSRIVCPDRERLRLLDCGGDDYFNTTPRLGSYLATHWNTASSSFLAEVLPACTVTGTGAGETIVGTSGADVLCGLGGDDTFFPGAGKDLVIGGEGIDAVDYATAGEDTVIANLELARAVGPTIGVDRLVGIENLFGHDEDLDILIGDEGDNVLLGRGDYDWLEGRGGDDTMDGGAFADLVTYENAPAGVVVNLATGVATGEGTDTLLSVADVTGSRYRDILYGSAIRNYIWGLGGNDTIYGRGGRDDLEGFGGGDTIYGGDASDRIFGQRGSDQLYGQVGNDRLDGGRGVDLCRQGTGIGLKIRCER
jgi:Ca2+-binding RTX toxin-like protein